MCEVDKMNKKYVIISKTRFTIFLTVLILVFSLLINLALSLDISHGFNRDEDEVVLIEVVVYQGDSLWTIAKEHITSKEDIRDVICQIEALNGIGPNIKPGDVILVPKYN